MAEHYKVQSFAFPDKDFPSFDVSFLTLASTSRIMSLNILALSPVVGGTFTQVGYEAGLPHVVYVHEIYVFLVCCKMGFGIIPAAPILSPPEGCVWCSMRGVITLLR